MKIGVVADTHSHPIPDQLLKDFRKTDMIIHAGDFCSIRDLNLFRRIKDVEAVYGNMDDPDLIEVLPEKLIIEADGYRIGVIHGRGSPDKSFEFVQAQFKKEKVDAVVFGHSHIPVQRMIGKVLYLNPGSPTDKVLTPYRSYALLETGQNGLSARIVKIEG